jgi:hypothetical protein
MNVKNRILKELSLQLRRDGLIYDLIRDELVLADHEAESFKTILELDAVIDNNAYFIANVENEEELSKFVSDVDMRHVRSLIEEAYNIEISSIYTHYRQFEAPDFQSMVMTDELQEFLNSLGGQFWTMVR